MKNLLNLFSIQKVVNYVSFLSTPVFMSLSVQPICFIFPFVHTEAFYFMVLLDRDKRNQSIESRHV